MRKIVKKTLAVFFAISFVIQLVSFNFSSSAAPIKTNTEALAVKITPELQDAMSSASPDEKLPILLDITQINEKTVKKEMMKSGWDYDTYYNKTEFEKKIKPQIQSRADEKLKLSEKNISPMSLEAQNDYQETLLDLEYQVRKDFKIARQNTIQSLQSEINEKFIKQNDIAPEDIIYVSKYVSYILLNADVATIKKLDQNSAVKKISYLDPDIEMKPAMADRSTSNQAKMNMLNSSYDCRGITIGILEYVEKTNPSDIKFRSGLDRSSPHLTVQPYINELQNDLIYSSDRIGPSAHGTAVTAIIAGAPVTINGNTYRGVTQNATVYVAFCDGLSPLKNYNFITQLEQLIGTNADVINMSMGTVGRNTYNTSYDELIDKYSVLGTLFVVAAGNYDTPQQNNISACAHAYNAIVVANASLIGNSSSYPINSSSCYNQDAAPYQTNKPDIAAAGTSIQVAISDTRTGSYDGTSFAAPFVTGAAARIIKIMPETLQDPTLVKTVLLAAANQTKISGDIPCTSDKTSMGTPLLLKKKSGAGLLDLDKAVEIVNNNQYSCQKVEITQPTGYTNMATFTPGNGRYAKVALCFNIIGTAYRHNSDGGPADAYYNLNIDLRIINNRTGQVVASSESLYNNVELVGFYATGDSYTIQYKITEYDLKANQDFIFEYRHTIACAWQWR